MLNKQAKEALKLILQIIGHWLITQQIGIFWAAEPKNCKFQTPLFNTAVPVPAAVWLFGSALAGLGVINRRKRQNTL
jgi:hypothetical protein